MGGGRWEPASYTRSKTARAISGTPDFAYTKTAAETRQVHDSLKANRIKSKLLGKLESRDSVDHPTSTPVFITIDVTGSNASRAVEAQAALPALMELLSEYIEDPQVCFGANDDFYTSQAACIQVSEFESDNRIDEWLRNTWLISAGGSNLTESYELLLYVAARKMVLDSVEVRNKKGYMFMYMDEMIPEVAKASEIRVVFGDDIQADIPIADLIEEARQNFEIWAIHPSGNSRRDARPQYVKLFGENRVIDLQAPSRICELVAVTVGLHEEKLSAEQAEESLVTTGMVRTEAKEIVKSASKVTPAMTKTKSRRGAARL